MFKLELKSFVAELEKISESYIKSKWAVPNKNPRRVSTMKESLPAGKGSGLKDMPPGS